MAISYFTHEKVAADAEDGTATAESFAIAKTGDGVILPISCLVVEFSE